MRALGSAYQRTIYHNELPSFLRPAFRPLPSHALTFPPFSPRSRLINKPVIALWSYWERALPIALAKVTGVKPISCRGNPGYSSARWATVNQPWARASRPYAISRSLRRAMKAAGLDLHDVAKRVEEGAPAPAPVLMPHSWWDRY